jgi:hypothetical protein
MPQLTPAAAMLAALFASVACASRAAADQRFCFGAGPAPEGYVRVLPGSSYSQAQGYGFEPGSTAAATTPCIGRF